MVQRILAPFDESPQSNAALHHALSTFPNADIHVLHVTDPREWSSMNMDGGFYSQEMYDQAQESATALLEQAESIADEYGTTVTTAMRDGRAADAIVKYAEEHDVDHVVLGSHGRRGLSRFLLGSVAERVARRSPGSVTIIREKEPKHGD
ncbi:universal stress protein [Halalkalicoccus paucihalophilus]|uniref:Universal stress protein n=1 Tax=Halalkalicoccus paucihalophilus TaxID=1008153 RepID=A0A151A9A9_9EURY|nr:universal stress protein [Halalkalicoccus paucihalophilus]KYH24199.1 universal stress protein [Halalkalicoccus paucihalophilus]